MFPANEAELVAFVSAQTERGGFGSALKCIRDYVFRIVTNPLCTATVFGSPALDRLCLHVGNQLIAKTKILRGNDQERQPSSGCVVMLASKLQDSGGHTRVLSHLLQSFAGQRIHVLSTEIDGHSELSWLDTALEGIVPRPVIELAPRSDLASKLAWAQRRLAELNPSSLHLFNHHQDSVALAATASIPRSDVFFYHHGDHHFSLGVYLPGAHHIDLHPMGYWHCRNALGLDNGYMPLLVNDRGQLPAGHVFLETGKLTTCTAARENKISPSYPYRYEKVIPELLLQTGGRHIHIGRLSVLTRWKIRRNLRNRGIALSRFVYKSFVPSVWDALHAFRVDLYLASFPFGGGLTLVEAMGAGIPVVVHKHIFSRILACLDLASRDTYAWSTPEELMNYCKGLTSERLAELSKLAREHYLAHHCQEMSDKHVSPAEMASNHPTMLESDFTVNHGEYANWILAQQRVWTQVRFRMYRVLKTLRAHFA